MTDALAYELFCVIMGRSCKMVKIRLGYAIITNEYL